MLADPIKAAMITSSVQLISASATIFAAWVAFRAWRRSTLGNRQIELAEECLLLLWEFDATVKSTRQMLVPVDFEEFESNERYKVVYSKCHKKAWDGIRECGRTLGKLRDKFLIAEFYLGDFPRVSFKGETRFFRGNYTIILEYDEIFGQFCSFLLEMTPQAVAEVLSQKSDRTKVENSANLFYGFSSDYEEDEYSARLKLTKQTFERHIKRRLRQTSIFTRTGETFSNTISDIHNKRVTPTTINKHPFRFSSLRSSSEKKNDIE